MANIIPTDEDFALATKVAEWMDSLNERGNEALNDYMSNLATFGSIGYTNGKGIGVCASAIQAYNREQSDKVQTPKAKSAHFGKVGDRCELHLKLLAVSDGQGNYGPWFLHKFADEAGNVFSWFGSKRLYSGKVRVEPGHEGVFKLTVKAHVTFKGVAETQLSRVTLAKE